MLLHTQKMLREGKTLDDLSSELGIKSNESEDGDLVILNYSQGSCKIGTGLYPRCIPIGPPSEYRYLGYR